MKYVMVDENFAKTWYRQWIEAWNSHDPRAVTPLITEDFKLSSPTTDHTNWSVRGKEATVGYVKYVVDAYPDLCWETAGEPLFAKHGPTVAFPWRGWGTFSGILNPPGVKGNGNKFEFFGVEVFDFKGGQASTLRVSYDLLFLLKQTGLYTGWSNKK